MILPLLQDEDSLSDMEVVDFPINIRGKVYSLTYIGEEGNIHHLSSHPPRSVTFTEMRLAESGGLIQVLINNIHSLHPRVERALRIVLLKLADTMITHNCDKGGKHDFPQA